MRIVLTLIMVAFTLFTGIAQNWRIGLLGQPCLTYYSVIGGSNPSLASDFKTVDKPIITYQAGLLLERKVSDKVSLLSGLIYAQHGIQSQYSTSNIYAFSPSPGYALKVIDRYVQIPLYANVYLKKSVLSWFFTVGLKPAIYINSFSKSTETDNQAGSFRYSAHRKVNVFAVLGIGAEIQLIERLQLLVWPATEYGLGKEVWAQPLSVYPYSAGINVCLFYSLGN